MTIDKIAIYLFYQSHYALYLFFGIMCPKCKHMCGLFFFFSMYHLIRNEIKQEMVDNKRNKTDSVQLQNDRKMVKAVKV